MESKMKTEFYISGKDKSYHIKEAYGSVYKKLKMILLNSSTTEPMQKALIAREFKLCDLEKISEYLTENKKNEIGVEQFYEQITNQLFIEEPKIKFDDLNIGEVNRAMESFFTSISAS